MWLDGVSPYHCVLAKVSLVGRGSAEPRAAPALKTRFIREPILGITPAKEELLGAILAATK